MKYYVIVCFAMFCSVAAVKCYAAAKVLGIPKQYALSPDGSILKDSKDADDKILWVVCSDRSNNNTYSTSSTKKVMKVMQYLEKFYVTDESGDFLRLYKYADDILENGDSRKLKKTAVDYGWALKSNLLLWTRCIVNDKRVPVRALPIITVPFMQQDLMPYMNFEESTLKLYKMPSLPVDSASITADMYQFLYVYKYEDSSVLLARKSVSSPHSIETDIVGWASKKVLQLWGGREFLEPAWDAAAYEERKKKNVTCAVFSNKSDAFYWQRSGISISPLWSDDPRNKPWGGEIKRFPIQEQDSTVFKIGLIVKFAYTTSKDKNKGNSGINKPGTNSFNILLPAFASLTPDNFKSKAFRKVVYLSSEELVDINTQLKKLLIDESGPAMRTGFATALTSILSGYVGSSKADEMIKKGKSTPADIIYFITGLPCKNETLSRCLVADITNGDKVTESDLSAMQKYLGDIYGKLTGVFGEPGMALKLSWDTFYWVPEDMLP